MQGHEIIGVEVGVWAPFPVCCFSPTIPPPLGSFLTHTPYCAHFQNQLGKKQMKNSLWEGLRERIGGQEWYGNDK